MENLVGRKLKCLESYDGVTKGKEYTITNVDNGEFCIIEDDGRKQKWCTSHLHSKGFFELLPKETQFKQGDKVLWSSGKLKDERGIFICKYENYFIVKHIGDEYDLENGTLRYAEKIRPYKEEIKVGDWVFLNDEKGVCKITNKHDLKEVNNKFILVKNPQLIKLLNEENENNRSN